MKEEFIRTSWVFGDKAESKLASATVIVFGVGGVGGGICEALARSNIGNIYLCDNDTVSLSNINRQIVALHSTVGKLKTDVMANRIHDINPDCNVTCINKFCTAENLHEIIPSNCDYIVDAIDTITSKIALAKYGQDNSIPVISSMGTGNKIDPTRFEVADIYKTSVCPLCRVMRSELKKRGIKKLKVVYTTEEPSKPVYDKTSMDELAGRRKLPPASVAFVPPVAGYIIAGEVVKDLLKN